MIISKIKIDS